MSLPPEPNEPAPELSELVVQCVLGYERDGEPGIERVLATAGELRDMVREHVENLRHAGLLQPPEQPESIGPYRVLQRLGSGGMGAVFLCEQREPIQRRVAVKVLRPGMDSREILARFSLERQALSLLDHPGIAKIHDAGASESGRPYLVMEYVAGQPLHRYCDERQLSMRSRLELFVRVCDAVQHAHHKGIVHRDLKPGNILVVDRDAAPWPMVIDFGVAKSLGGRLQNATLVTLPGRMLGTPEYMSPEQALNDQDVDTRTDVYSLGVILYELMTGTLPIESSRLRSSSDVAAVLRNFEPPTPSTRITTLGEAGAAAALRRGTDATGLKRLLRGDLDWIVLKAIDKDRNRRYGMPGELAADIRRHLAHEPVTAARPGIRYRFTKYWARHRLQVTAASLVLAALGTGLLFSIVAWRDAAASARDSSASLDDALLAVDELVQVGDSDLVSVPHLEKVRRSLLERSVEFYRRFLDRAPAGDPRLQPRTAEALVQLGGMQGQLGQHAAAIPNLQAGLLLFDQLRAAGRPLPVPQEVRACHALAEAAERGGDEAVAVAAYERARQRLMPGPTAPDDPHLRSLLVRTRRSHGRLLSHAGDPAALAALTEAVELGQPLAADPVRHRARMPNVVHAGTDLGRHLLAIGRRDDGVQQLLSTKQLWESTLASSPDWQLTLAGTELAGQLAECDRAAEALAVLEVTLVTHERLVRDHGDIVLYRSGLATAHSEQSSALLRRWQYEDGLRVVAMAESDHMAALALAPDDHSLLNNAAFAALTLAQAHLIVQEQKGPADLEVARAAVARAFERTEHLQQVGYRPRTLHRLRMDVLRARSLLAVDPKGDAALADLAAAIEQAEALIAVDPSSVYARERRVDLSMRLADAKLGRGAPAVARTLLLAAIEEQKGLIAKAAVPGMAITRRRMMLHGLARAEAALGSVDGVLWVAREYDLQPTREWRACQDLARLLVTLVRGPLREHARVQEVLARAREVVQLGIATGDEFERTDGKITGTGMIAVMRAQNWQILVDLERLAGDPAAEARALGKVASSYARAFADAPDESSETRLRESCVRWGEALTRAGDPGAVIAALGEMSPWFAGRSSSLAAVASIASRYLATHGDAEQVRQRGRELLRAAVTAGFDAAAVPASEDLNRLGPGW